VRPVLYDQEALAHMDEWLQEQIEQGVKLLQLLSSPLCRGGGFWLRGCICI
jgi:hypothetical protein